MTTDTSKNVNQKKCGSCGSNRTDIINKAGILVFRWFRNPYRKDTWMCGTCYRRHVYLRADYTVWHKLLGKKERE